MRLRALLFVLLICAAGCRPSGKPKVGVIPKGANHLFWQTVHAGALKAAAEYGLEIEWNAPPTEVDTPRQIDIVQSMVSRRLAGIAVAPTDRQALVAVIERAAEAGIPVCVFDSEVDTRRRLAYVSTNNEEAGRLAARRMGEILGGRGKVAVIGFKPGSASTMERESGFLEETKKLFPRIEVAAVQFGLADRAKSMAVTENVLTAYPDLAALYADNESSSAGAVQALKSRNARQVKLVAMDSSEQLVADMKAGWIDSFVLQNPFKMGYESVRVIGEKLAGRTPPPMIDSGLALVLPQQLEEPRVRELLFPDIQRWLQPAPPR
jgi:ribose transport system substrate-binding protein